MSFHSFHCDTSENYIAFYFVAVIDYLQTITVHSFIIMPHFVVRRTFMLIVIEAQ